MKLTESYLRKIIREEASNILKDNELFVEIFGGSKEESDFRVRTKLEKLIPMDVLSNMDRVFYQIKQPGHSVQYLNWFLKKFGSNQTGSYSEIRFKNDKKFVGRLAGEIITDYTWHGVQPSHTSEKNVNLLFDYAHDASSVTGIQWYKGTCYRGLVMQAEIFMKGVNAEEMRKLKQKPGWFSNPLDRLSSVITLEPTIPNYYNFASLKQHPFFVSFSTSKKTARSYAEDSSSIQYWTLRAKMAKKKNIEVLNPLFECEVPTIGSVIDPRVRINTIDKEKKEGLNEILGCPYISKNVLINRILIPYEDFEQAVKKHGGGVLASYTKNLDEAKIANYVEDDNFVIDIRKGA